MERRCRVLRSSLAVILVAISSPLVRGLEKHWLGDVEWQNPINWQDGLSPETDSRVVFPMEMRHAVGLPRSAELRLAGVELPRDGILALSEHGQFIISERSQSAGGRESRWLRETPYFWVDPLNWDASSEAVPHLERLPCQGDLVVLPASSKTFSVRLPESRNVEVQAVRLADDNETLPRWQWRSMGENAEFLASRFSVKYSPLMECENCLCQEGDLSEYWEEICNVQRPRCAPSACEYPLEVEGHCCYYCGGRIRLSKKTLLSTAQRVAKHALKGYEDMLSWHSRLTWDGYSEILITEKDVYMGGNTIVAVADVEAALKEEGVEVLHTETSGGPIHDYRLAVGFSFFFGGFFILLLLVLLLFPIFGYTYSQVWEACREFGAVICIEARVNGRKKKSFAFARFENIQEGNVQLTEDEETSVAQSVTGETFENPLYRSKKQSKTGYSGDLEKKLNLNEPVSLAVLEQAIELNQTEEIEMDIENL